MFRWRVTNDCTARAKNTQPPHSTIILGFTPWEKKYQKLSAVQAYLERRDLVPGGQIFNLRTPDRIVISPGMGATTAGSSKEV